MFSQGLTAVAQRAVPLLESWASGQSLHQNTQRPGHRSCPFGTRDHQVCDAIGLVCPLQREILPSTRLGTLPPAFSTRVLPAQATEYAFAFIQVPQDVSRCIFSPFERDCLETLSHSCSPYRLTGVETLGGLLVTGLKNGSD